MVTPESSFEFKEISPYGLAKQIEHSAVPVMVWCGWLDANPCEGALIRYRMFSNPQVVVIGPLSHGGSFNVDPFATSYTPPAPPRDEQFKMEADFFERVLDREPPEKIESSIQYYTMGEGAWHTSKVWPPEGLTAERLYFAERNGLSALPPVATDGRELVHGRFHGVEWQADALAYAVGRWRCGISGSRVLTLEMASTTSDGAIHAYLEDVSPEGRVTYLDEGVFRVIHHKEVDPKSLPYQPLGPAHRFLRTDAVPLTPGEPTTIRFSLFPTSLLLRKGHRVRVALGGTDASLFQRLPAEGTPTWTVYREARRASFVELPGRKRTP